MKPYGRWVFGGTGLYSGDGFAHGHWGGGAVPFEPDRLVKILCGIEPTAANDEKRRQFWLIVADQFDKRCSVERKVTK